MAPYIATICESVVHHASSTNWKSNHPERFWVDYIIEASSNDHARVSNIELISCVVATYLFRFYTQTNTYAHCTSYDQNHRHWQMKYV